MSEIEKATEKRSNQRRILSKFVDLPVTLLIKCGVTPNMLSFFGFACSITVAFLLSMGGLHFPFSIAWIIPFIMFWAGAFDVFDGEVARRTGSISKSGAFLDSNLDRLSDAAIILGLALGNFLHFIFGYIIIFLIIMISYIRARAENEGIDMKGVGFMERAERLIILWFAFIAEYWIYFLSNLFYGAPFELFFPIFALIFTGLLTLTIAQRLIFTFKSLSKIETHDKN
ncbi:MAG: CDP-alcohol phosphatidyltransferase family protein [Candidatus Lokiarchaeota archaeon]|nr:CDP-alcohol phosphatidyltransferase family protein [Candidatus Lokiarchaeota archaeon]